MLKNKVVEWLTEVRPSWADSCHLIGVMKKEMHMVFRISLLYSHLYSLVFPAEEPAKHKLWWILEKNKNIVLGDGLSDIPIL